MSEDVKGCLGLASHPLAFSVAPPPLQEMPSEAPEDAPDPHGLCQSSVSLDHCYLSLSENSKVPSSSSSEDTDTELGWKQQEVRGAAMAVVGWFLVPGLPSPPCPPPGHSGRPRGPAVLQ